jgi:hypothetical protein
LNATLSLGYQVNHLCFWSVIIVIATGVVSMFYPLDVPGGYAAEHADRVPWLSANRGVFIDGWLNQIVAMFSLSVILFCGAWQVAGRNPPQAILAASFFAMAFVFKKSISSPV